MAPEGAIKGRMVYLFLSVAVFVLTLSVAAAWLRTIRPVPAGYIHLCRVASAHAIDEITAALKKNGISCLARKPPERGGAAILWLARLRPSYGVQDLFVPEGDFEKALRILLTLKPLSAPGKAAGQGAPLP